MSDCDVKNIPITLSANVTDSSVARSKRWLVAQVHFRHEKKTAAKLEQMGVEYFLPVQQEIHQWSDRRKEVERVVIPMIIFVRVDHSEQREVLDLASVSRYMVLRGESTPAVIPDDQMQRFKFMLDYSGREVCMSTASLSPGEKIQVIKGPLSGLSGELITVNGKSKVAVRLKMLGCACVDIPTTYIEKT